MSKNSSYGISFLVIIAVFLTSCGGQGKKKAAVAGNEQAAKPTAKHYTVEDTVRLQLGGKLYGLDVTPDDSITVFHTFHSQPKGEEFYREYGFIVHNRHTPAHRDYEPVALDSLYNSRDKDRYLFKYDSLMRTELLDSAAADFNGYWIPLEERGSEYYIDDNRAPLGSFLLADSVITWYYMDGIYLQKIQKATVSSEGILSVVFNEEKEIQLEPVDREREIYRYTETSGTYYMIPARAIHNVELIQWVNTTGDMIM